MIEFRNFSFSLGNHSIPYACASFQVVIPQDNSNSLWVHYCDMPENFTRYNTTIGVKIGNYSDIQLPNSHTNRVATGDTIHFHFGTASSPLLDDTDGDGLDDAFEHELGTSLRNPDTDDDELPDGWEVLHGISPFTAQQSNGSRGDPDGDFLSNLEEYKAETNPQVVDTDEDSLSDLRKVGGFLPVTMPWFNLTNAVDLTSSFQNADDFCFTHPLSMPLQVQGTTITQITFDVNGLIHLVPPNSSDCFYPQSFVRPMTEYYHGFDCITLAPFWNNMRIVLDSPSSKIQIGDGNIGTNRYCVIEYSHLNTTAETYSISNRVSFQLSIPYGNTDAFYVRYVNFSGRTSGQFTSVGFQRYSTQEMHDYCYFEPSRIYPNFALKFVLSTTTNPLHADTDYDNLLDGDEFRLGANPIQADTDGDGLPDGWKAEHGLNPTSPLESDEQIEDPDGDGVSNGDEYEWGTDPSEPDTDEDGINDGEEIEHASDPTDASDGGLPASRIPVSFTFGDPSGSHSEKYRLVLTPLLPTPTTQPPDNLPRPIEWVNADFGVCDTKKIMLVRGSSYEIRLYHAGTSDSYAPDYDYTLSLSFPPGVGILLDDPSELLGDDDSSSYFGGEGKVATVTLLDALFSADYNRDGHIDTIDQIPCYRGKTLRHWINNDADCGDITSGNDNVPSNGGTQNYSNQSVDGRSDLLDFTPILLNIKSLLTHLEDISNYDFILSQQDGAVNIVWTSFTSQDAGSFLKHPAMLCGESFNDYVHEAEPIRVTANGISLPSTFLNLIQSQSSRGVMIMEGRCTTTKPLVFSCYKKGTSPDDPRELVFQLKLQLSILPVESMYRWVNLRGLASNGSVSRNTQIAIPSNLPDSETKNLNVLFLHGFNVTETEARGWHSELFKRLHQSGSNARFWAVSWHGDQGFPNAFNYHNNVYNAFLTASHLANFIQTSVTGPTVIMAHSLGNMVVSSAIQDHGLNVSRYFMLNAAIPSEAFNPSLFNETPSNPLVHEYWRAYTNRTWSCKWHALFPSTDDRSKLTWRGRFVDVLSVAYNFYSSGDEVFELYDGTPGPLTGGSSSKGRYSWHKQEAYKGRLSNENLAWAGTKWSGWGFRQAPWVIGNQVIWTNCYSAAMATAIPIASLTTNTVFNLQPRSMNTNSIPRIVIEEHLAKGIPALSRAVGNIRLNQNDENSFNLNTDNQVFLQNGWCRITGDLKNRWLHADIKDVAFYFNHGAFDILVNIGEVK